MVSSQDIAIAAALTELGYDLEPTRQCCGSIPGGAAEGKLKPHDLITEIDGTKVTTQKQVVDRIGAPRSATR